MNTIGRYEKKVSERPKTFIVVLIIITLFLSFFASQMQMDSGENDFQPDTEVAKANSMINEEYGEEQNQVTVVTVSEDNVLERTTLITQLQLEEKIIESEKISPSIEGSSRNPSGVSSPADLIAQAKFVNRTLELMREFSGGGGFMDGNQEIQKELMSVTFSLTADEKVTVLEGGELTLDLDAVPHPINLDFHPYEPKELDFFYSDPIISAALPLEDVLSFLLSNDYDKERQTAGKSLMSIAVKNDLSEDEALDVEKEIKRLAEETEGEGTNLRVLGDALVNDKINEASGRNIALLMPIAFIFVIVVLAIMYRNITDTVLNLTALIMAIVWVYGIGVLLDLNLGNPMMTTVPVLIIGLGIDYGIHYTSRYREEIHEGKEIGEAITKTGATVGLAILLTTVTTVVGFMSNIISNISAIRDFGVLCSVGIISAFVLMLTFFPAAKTLIDRRRKKKGKQIVKKRKKRKDNKKKTIGKRIWSMIGEPEDFCGEDGGNCPNNGLGIGAIAARTPWKVVIVILMITSASIYGGAQLEARYDFRDFLPDDLEITDTFNMVIEDFDFSEETVYILVEGDITQPDVFREIEGVQSEAMNSDLAVEAREPESPIELAYSMINENSPSYNPSFQATWFENIDKDRDGSIDEDITSQNVSAIYNSMMEHGEDVNKVLNKEDGEFQGLLIRIPVDTEDQSNVEELRDDMQEASEPLKSEDLERVLVTGGPIVSYSTFKSINDGQVQTLLITFLIALAILSMLYLYMKQGILLGFVTILPLVFVISWTFGTMYFINIPLNPVTVTIAAITVGLGIDYSIHLTQRFIEDSKKMEKPECALCVSTSHTGSALFGSATTTVVGFGILSLAIIPPLAQFGKVSAISIFFAFLAAVFVLPTFLLVWYKFRHR